MTPPVGRQLLDLHNHSDRSYDASNTLADYERAHAAGRFDVVAITDHNRIDGALAFAAAASFPVIVGMEIDTAEGELIGLFLEETIPTGLPASETAERIRAYQAGQDKHLGLRWPTLLAIALGGLLLGAGVLLFVAAHLWLPTLVERKGDHDDAVTLYRTALAFDDRHKGAREALRRLGAEP